MHIANPSPAEKVVSDTMETVTFDEQNTHGDIRKGLFHQGVPCNANPKVGTLNIVVIGWRLQPSGCHWLTQVFAHYKHVSQKAVAVSRLSVQLVQLLYVQYFEKHLTPWHTYPH